MAQKRRRTRLEQLTEPGNKRLRISRSQPSNEKLVKQSLLSQYYPQVLTLREYLLSRLPISSKARRKKIASVKCRVQHGRVDEAQPEELSLARYLDQTLVGVPEGIEIPSDERWKQWVSFSQRGYNSTLTARTDDGDEECSQSEVRILLLLVVRGCSGTSRIITNFSYRG